MNKKYYLVALVCAVAGTSVISSCKDTDEDLYTELRNELAFNAGQYDKLSKALDDLAGKTVDFVNKSAMTGTILAHVDGGVANLIVNIDS